MRLRRGLIISGLFSALLLAGTSGVHPAAGQADAGHLHGDEADEIREHMALDLADTPISEIERRTAVNAARIQRDTGHRPGTPVSRVAVSADPGRSGSWSPVVGTPVVPVFDAVLPNGKVLIWDSVGDNAAESYPDHDFTRVMVWNPADNTYKRVDLQGANIFCAGFAHLPDGDILVAGGNADSALDGTVWTHIFHWQTETWTRGENMAVGRWYPAVAETANGEEVIVGGGPKTAEVYQSDGALRPLTAGPTYAARVYPFLGSRPDSQLQLFGPPTTSYTVTTSGNGVITATGTRDAVARDYGGFATYDVGRTLVTGGGNLTEGGVAQVPTRTSVVLNTTGAGATVTTTGSLSTGRRQLNTTLLADGSVLATGGLTSTRKSPLVDLDSAATAAERWDPATGAWTVLAGAGRIRQYHSTAALLPDGRVLTGGGGVCGICTTVGYLEKNIEYFSPPYLYRQDGSGRLADRPVISAAPAGVDIATPFAVTSPQASSIRKVALVGLADVTHGIDQGQRYIPLRFSAAGTTLTVTGPPSGGVAPPGYYMLFVVDAAGVPSVAKVVKVARQPNPLMSPIRSVNGGDRCVDVPAAAVAIRTYLQFYDCNGSKAQALTRVPADDTLRVMGNCLDVPGGNFASGQRIWTYTCNGSASQAWELGPGGVIRPVGHPTLCLRPVTADNQAEIQIISCSRSLLQKWRW
ncbi:galactose oxidase [Actinoplanes sp. SE50]|uniref:galactose oxidase-like domain-containing protein n=1 Tax=unclassified Actinoplanes TaxID=2626549 RepID=UPI00023EE0BD|nr:MULTISPECIES: galactose oxidase-like domain-containing protein [unclassified Actinoplanes]AEV88478.1 galactose oxidase [Actinoplanes sp. SE50/110]ATO86883.1 galactose oxidase [Actinoplanes sp. SE50]SLM04301.1 galactose oxidase [Actinoplanes sp. SE50/110]